MTSGVDPRSSFAGRRVLVVEDEALLAFEMVDELERLGAVPIGPVPTVAEALAFMNGGDLPDAALLNFYLRGEASLPIAAALAERDIPFIFVTGNDEVVRATYPEVPCHPKPSDMPVLIKALGALLGSRQV